MFDTKQENERVILVGVQTADGDDTQDSLDELEQLAQTAGDLSGNPLRSGSPH